MSVRLGEKEIYWLSEIFNKVKGIVAHLVRQHQAAGTSCVLEQYLTVMPRD